MRVIRDEDEIEVVVDWTNEAYRVARLIKLIEEKGLFFESHKTFKKFLESFSAEGPQRLTDAQNNLIAAVVELGEAYQEFEDEIE